MNSWDRMPFITTYDSGKPSTKPKQTYVKSSEQDSYRSHHTIMPNDYNPITIVTSSDIRQNFVMANYHAVWPLDHDDGSCYYYDYDNVLVYGGFKTYLGHSKICKLKQMDLFHRHHSTGL